jgi:hypothetical protein
MSTTSSVTPMRLVPVNDFGTSAQLQTLSMNEPERTAQQSLSALPIITSAQVNTYKQNLPIGKLSNLDTELLDILHNNDLTEDAKAKLYWVALHKAEIYKDKSMWTEPVIVEVRENRFIPVPIIKSENQTGTVASKAKSNGKRKISSVEMQTNTMSEPTTSISNVHENETSSVTDKVEDSNNTLKRIALVNRIQNGGVLNPSSIDRNIAISKPLVVYGQQDQVHQSNTPSTHSHAIPSTFGLGTPQLLPIQEQVQAHPVWFQTFLKTIATEPENIRTRIIGLIEKIIKKDSKFQITRNSFLTGNKELFGTDPKNFLKQLVKGTQKSTARSEIFFDYLNKLGITVDQLGSGFKRKNIKLWVKL